MGPRTQIYQSKEGAGGWEGGVSWEKETGINQN